MKVVTWLFSGYCMILSGLRVFTSNFFVQRLIHILGSNRSAYLTNNISSTIILKLSTRGLRILSGITMSGAKLEDIDQLNKRAKLAVS